jgi:hypothetical protein
LRKRFPITWIKQAMCTVQCGKVCININGERSQNFSTYQGLRQGGPLSPILFNLVADVLGSLMNKAAKQGKIKGVMTHLIEEGIAHIQYADDTILMIQSDDMSVSNMKFLLYCFEWLSGLKINYHKSEAFMFGMDEEEKTRIANMLNCQLGGLPMKYLGVTVSDVKLGRGAFKNVSEKISKRTPSWQGKQMSSRARLILSNNYLSSLPTYMMDFYLLPLSTHKEMDGIRSKFFRRGAGTEFKYHMIKWPAVCRPKKFGGLGIVNTQVFNVCLMTKWIWKLYNHKNCLWVRLLTAKYMRDEDFFKSKGTQGSQFWKSLHKVKHMFKWGAVHKVGNGKKNSTME